MIMNILKVANKHLNNKKGNSSIIFLASITVLVALMAFITDAGMMYLEKSRLQNDVDAIALAGIQEFRNGDAAMMDKAYEYANLNQVDPLGLEVTIPSGNRSITVVAKKKVNLFFAKVFNMTDAVIQARATAKAGAIVAANGIRPFAVEQQNFEIGHTYTLKKGAGDAYTGNYGALALGGTGSTVYKNNLMYGFDSNVKIGDLVKVGEDLTTEPGNMAGPTYDGMRYLINSDTHDHSDLNNLEADCQRLIIVPIIDKFDPGRSTVKIMGFAKFFIDDVTYDGGKTEVKGRFVRALEEGKIDDAGNDFGLFGVKLIE